MPEDNDSFSSEFDEAIKNQNEGSMLQPSFLCLLSLKEIIKVCGNEFHDGMIIRNNEGQITAYLPDMLDAFCNSVDQLKALLGGYADDAFDAELKKLSCDPNDRNSRRKYYLDLEAELLKLMKRINIMPGENSYGIEIIGLTKAERKMLLKSDKEESDVIIQ